MQEQKCATLFTTPTIIASIVKRNIGFSWFGGPKKSQETKTIENVPSGCSRRKPSRVDLCKGDRSNCLEDDAVPSKKPKKRFFSFRKQPVTVKRQPDNCKDVKVKEEKLSFWEQAFGPDPKRSWPDPCTCRLVNRQNKLCQREDPRLRDPRYQATPGDVLLYTEFPRYGERSHVEPQPKPPPLYKLPKALVCKKAMEVSERVPSNCGASAEQTGETRKDDDVEPAPYKIPYEEMRPPERRRTIFSCKKGIQSEDIMKPLSKESNEFILMQNTKTFPECTRIEESPVNEVVKKPEGNQTSDQKPQKRSRIEQLKTLIEEKNTSKYILRS